MENFAGLVRLLVTPEGLKTLLVAMHGLVAGAVLYQTSALDIRLFKTFNRPLEPDDVKEFIRVKHMIKFSLYALWISGALLVLNGYNALHSVYLVNEKLWAKVIIVMILTLNGFILHRLVFPLLAEGVVFLRLKRKEHLLASLTGAISTASWVWAVGLGFTRILNHKVPVETLLYLYLISIGILWIAVGVAIKLLLLPKESSEEGATQTENI